LDFEVIDLAAEAADLHANSIGGLGFGGSCLLGEHLSETVSIFDGLGHRRGFVGLGIAEGCRIGNSSFG
jgi:hypothetical protein